MQAHQFLQCQEDKGRGDLRIVRWISAERAKLSTDDVVKTTKVSSI